MNYSSRRALYPLVLAIFTVLFIPNFSLWMSGEAVSWETGLTTKKTEVMLPFIHMMEKSPFMKELYKDNEYIRFVSKEFALNEKAYAPKDLELLTWSSIDTAGRVIYLRNEASSSLNSLAKEFEKEFKRPLVVVSGYRSASYQQRLWDLGRCTDTLCAPPWYSEHQLGLAIDIFEATTEEDYLANRAFARYLSWLQEHAHEYGFHQSYQKWEQVDAYEVEPWHWRYLWKSLATELHNLNMTYTEYMEFMSMRKFWKPY